MIREGVVKLLREHFSVDEVPLNVPPKPEMGDFSSALCLSLAKQKKRPPLEIAREAVKAMQSELPPFIREIGVTPPGYLNFRVDWPGLARHLISQVFEEKDLFGKPSDVTKEKVFIDFIFTSQKRIKIAPWNT